jgi:hypothetical protein
MELKHADTGDVVTLNAFVRVDGRMQLEWFAREQPMSGSYRLGDVARDGGMEVTVHGELQVEVDRQWLIKVDRGLSQEHAEVIAARGDKALWVLMVTDDRGNCVNHCNRRFRVQLELKQALGRSKIVDKELHMEGGRLRFECTCASTGEYELVVEDDSDTRIVGSATVSPGPLHTFKVVETEAMKKPNKGSTDRWLEVRLQSVDAYGNPCPCPEGCKLEAAAIFSPNALQGTTEGES